jgi:putative ABC transport system permease protein
VAADDVLYLGVRERAAELATLRATGWPDRTEARLVISEGAVIGLLGASTGAALSIAAAAGLAGELSRVSVTGALAAAGAAVLLAVLASTAPALMAGRQPLAAGLTRE